MNKDNFEGTVRSAVGQGEKILGQATNDRVDNGSRLLRRCGWEGAVGRWKCEGRGEWRSRRDLLPRFLRVAR